MRSWFSWAKYCSGVTSRLQFAEGGEGAVGLVGQQASGADGVLQSGDVARSIGRERRLLRRRQQQRFAGARIVQHRITRQRDAGLLQVGERRRVIHVAEVARMLLIVGERRDLRAHVLDDLGDVDRLGLCCRPPRPASPLSTE